MEQIKCTECGEFYDDSLNKCPKCGYPKNSNQQTVEIENCETIDTGLENERVIQTLADLIYDVIIYTAWIISIVVEFLLLVSTFKEPKNAAIFLFGLIGFGIYIYLSHIFARIVKAFLMVYANISINLHEINMKFKTNDTYSRTISEQAQTTKSDNIINEALGL